jgi:hypothetical protein
METENKTPKFLAIIVGIGANIEKLDSGVYVIPFDCLGY